MRRIVALVLALPLASVAFAQDPTSTDPDKYKAVFENDCVRVLEYRDLPGEKTRQHRHPAFVLYALSSFQRTLELPGGRLLQRQFRQGEAMWSDSQVHIGANTGQTPTHVLIVEMKPGVGDCAGR